MTLSIPFDGAMKKDSEQQLNDAIMQLSGIECVVVSPNEKSVAVSGGDLDYLSICDVIENLGFTVIR